MKKIIAIMLSILTVFIFFLIGCDSKEDNTAQKTVLDRARELTKYCDRVPSNHAELMGFDNDDKNADENIVALKTEGISMLRADMNNEEEVLTPDYRPDALPSHTWSASEAEFVRTYLDEEIKNVKAQAMSLKECFGVYTLLNQWIATGLATEKLAVRLNYDQAFDCIQSERIFENGPDYVSWRVERLRLGKNHKVQYTSLSYRVDCATGALTNVNQYEYVEDDYYYRTGYMGDYASSSILYVNLKTNPRQTFLNETSIKYSEGVGLGEKIVRLDFEDGTTLSFSEAWGYNDADFGGGGSIRSYDQDGNIMLNMNGVECIIDLWQTTGWISAVSENGDWQDGVLNTATGTYENGYELQSNYGNLYFSSGVHPADDDCVSAKIYLYTEDDFNVTVEDINVALSSMGLSLKSNNSVFEEYFMKGYEHGVSQYHCPKMDFRSMTREEMKQYLVPSDSEEKISAFVPQLQNMSIVDEITARYGNYVNEAYVMLDVDFHGSVNVDFESCHFDCTSLEVVIPDSVLHIEGAKYIFKVGLFDGERFLELAKGEETYNNGEIIIGISTGNSAIIFEELTERENYTLATYICNANGMRYSEFFYPDVYTDGKEEKTFFENNEEWVVNLEVKNGDLTVYKTKK